jgi:hypothetical protein
VSMPLCCRCSCLLQDVDVFFVMVMFCPSMICSLGVVAVQRFMCVYVASIPALYCCACLHMSQTLQQSVAVTWLFVCFHNVCRVHVPINMDN